MPHSRRSCDDAHPGAIEFYDSFPLVANTSQENGTKGFCNQTDIVKKSALSAVLQIQSHPIAKTDIARLTDLPSAC